MAQLSMARIVEYAVLTTMVSLFAASVGSPLIGKASHLLASLQVALG
jgi:hypothetical protein